MPKKIRELKAMLLRAGFYSRPGKGSHVVFKHHALPADRVTLSGSDGDDAKPYHEKDVKDILRKLREVQK